MYSRFRFMRMSGAVLILALLVLGAHGGRSVEAGPGVTLTATVAGPTNTPVGTGVVTKPATVTVTASPTTTPGGPTATPQATATRRAATAAANAMQFPLCTPTSTMEAGSATEAATEAAGATEAATEATPNPGFVGVVVQQVDACGARVTVVDANSPAARAGIRVGDIIVGIDGEAVTSLDYLRDELSDHKAGDKVHLTVQRGNREQTFEVTLGAGMAL